MHWNRCHLGWQLLKSQIRRRYCLKGGWRWFKGGEPRKYWRIARNPRSSHSGVGISPLLCLSRCPNNLKLARRARNDLCFGPVGLPYLVAGFSGANGVNSNRLSMNIKRPPAHCVEGRLPLIKTLLIRTRRQALQLLVEITSSQSPAPTGSASLSLVTKSIFSYQIWPRKLEV